MESSVVPPEITAELTQILANLVLGDNNIRASAEKAVNDRLAQTPDLYLLALAQFAIAADTEIMRSFSLVLLRRLLFRPSAAQQQQPHQLPPKDPRMTLYDQLPVQALTTLERLLLHSLSHEASDSVRRKAVDTVTDLANNAMARGRPWHALQAQTFSMAQADRAGYRECAYRVFGGCPNLVMDLQTDAVLSVFQKGLQDGESTEVRHAALEACVSYLSASDAHQLSQSLSLLYPMLDTLPALPDAQLKLFLNTLIPLASSHPSLFAPHLPNLLAYMRALIMPAVDSGPTPTVSKPFPGSARRSAGSSGSGSGSGPSSGGGGGGSAFTFPPEGHVSSPDGENNGSGSGSGGRSGDGGEEGDEDEEDKDAVRKAALELMVSLSEAKPAMVRRTDGWTLALVRACLEGMGELPEDGTEAWLEADPADETDEAYPHAYEQALDRLACALGGKAVLPPAFQYIPSMLADYDWRLRHAGLMAIAAIAEGTSKVMQNELGKVVELVTPMFKDAHPRVRYAACQCVGQLCTDLEEIIQERYHEQLFSALIPTLEAPEPRVHAHAAAALINFCEGVAHDTLVPYLDPIVERLLKLLDPHGEQGQRVKRYVQEQVITSLAMVADASEATFAKHYASIMPLLLNVLRNANSPEYHKIRVKAMECAGLIAIAVGRDVFRPDASTLIELLIKIQGGPHDPNDTLLANYLIATWAKICQAMGPDFEPYLPVVMPPLLNAANAKADVSVYDEDDENGYEEREGWETINMDGRIVGIRTSTIEEKCQAFETLLIYAATLDGRFAPYLTQALELALPALRFYFHEGVREAACRLIPTLFSCGKHSSTLSPQIVSASFLALVKCIATETDPSFLASLYRAFIDALLVIGGARALPPELQHGVLDATKHQLQALADRRKGRAERAPHELEDDRQELALIEEMEDYALEDVARLLRMFDAQHPLLVAVSSVRDLGFNQFDEDADEDG